LLNTVNLWNNTILAIWRLRIGIWVGHESGKFVDGCWCIFRILLCPILEICNISTSILGIYRRILIRLIAPNIPFRLFHSNLWVIDSSILWLWSFVIIPTYYRILWRHTSLPHQIAIDHLIKLYILLIIRILILLAILYLRTVILQRAGVLR